VSRLVLCHAMDMVVSLAGRSIQLSWGRGERLLPFETSPHVGGTAVLAAKRGAAGHVTAGEKWAKAWMSVQYVRMYMNHIHRCSTGVSRDARLKQLRHGKPPDGTAGAIVGVWRA